MYVLYTPSSEDAYPTGLYLKDSDSGDDWYETLDKYDNDLVKIAYDKEGVVRWIFKDPTTVFPVDCEVISLDNPPEDILQAIPGEWLYKDGKLSIDNSSAIIEAQSKVEKEMAWSSSNIEAFKDISESRALSKTEDKYLKALKQYRIDLLSIEPEDAPDIKWPERPSKK